MENSTFPDRSEPGAVIQVSNLTKDFGGQRILDGVTFEIAGGEFLVVLGPSGSGKTTLLRIIAGLEHSDSGEISLHGQDAHALSPQLRRLGVVFQEHALFHQKTVEENIAFGLETRKLSKVEVKSVTTEMLTLIGLGGHRKKYPSQLSGGQRQRVALARALAYRPDAMLFDEPFSSLDAGTKLELRREVRALLRERNIPALFITHDQEEALEMADRIIVLNEGKIEQAGTPFEVYNQPRNEFVATFLGAANVLLGRWSEDKVILGRVRLNTPPDAPNLIDRQPVKVVFRPEDVVLNFQTQLLDTPYVLGRAVVEEVSYIGHSERLIARLMLWSPQLAKADSNPGALSLVDESYAEGFPLVITRNKWDAGEMELAAGDTVVVGLKGYRLMPHYPLRHDSGAKVVIPLSESAQTKRKSD